MTRMKTFRLALIPALLAVLTACNTVDGFGEDVESGGEAIQEGAQETSEAISQ